MIPFFRKSMLSKVFLFLLLMGTSVRFVFSQQQNLPLHTVFSQNELKYFNNPSVSLHSTFKPVLQSKSMGQEPLDSVLSEREISYFNRGLEQKRRREKSWPGRKLFHEHFIMVDSGKFYLTVDPQLNFQYGKDMRDTTAFSDTATLYRNTRGFLVRGNIGEKFSFQSSFYENQAIFPSYVSRYAEENGVIPGQGRYKSFKKTGFDYASAQGYISYSPVEQLNLQAGHGKFFIGDGYRSMLLSDAAFNYPYFKASVWLWKDKIQYNILYASFQSLNRITSFSSTEALFERKSGNFHFLNWKVAGYFHLGIFEAGIFQTQDSTGTRPFNWSSLNPVIGANTALYGLDGVNNHLLGLNGKFMTPFDLMVYWQYALDGLTDEQTALQAGVSYRGLDGLLLQVEYNKAKRDVYENAVPLQDYAHYNQSLAHPYGNDFDEWVGIINYRLGRAFARLEVINATRENRPGRFDPLVGDAAAEADRLTYVNAEAGFLINPASQLNLYAGVTKRELDRSNPFSRTLFFYGGIKTSLRNLYYDF